jgi:hypothetical protein
MITLFCNVSALAVATIFYTWRRYYWQRFQHHRQMLCQRLAYMLWVAASVVE